MVVGIERRSRGVVWEACTSPLSFIFSSSWVMSDAGASQGGGEGRLTLYGAYHLARRVLPLVHVSYIDTITEALHAERLPMGRTAGSGSG